MNLDLSNYKDHVKRPKKIRVVINRKQNKKKHKESTNNIIIVVEMNDKRIIYNYKQVRDTVYQFIKLSNIAFLIIDTSEFKRLKDIRQLGTTYHVYPAASHSRFEHSIGTYYVAGWILESIKKNTSAEILNECLSTVPELQDYYTRTYGDLPHNKLDNYVCELIKIAALCHDVGHGPYSHGYDDVALPAIRKEINNTRSEEEKIQAHPYEIHEVRSCEILNYIIKNNDVLSDIIKDNEIQFMKDLINPSDKHVGFVYQIVSNSLNGVDIDKIDYIARDIKTLDIADGFEYKRLIDDAKVIGNNICYPWSMRKELVALFEKRYKMHKTVYGHKTVVGILYMITDIMILMNPILDLYGAIFDIEAFCELTDSYILENIKSEYKRISMDIFKNNYTDDQKARITCAYNIWKRIQKRDLYKCIMVKDSTEYINLNESGFFDKVSKDEVIVHNSKMGYVSGSKKNPLDSLYFYDSKTPDESMNPPKEELTRFISDTYQEYVCMIFIKDSSNVELVRRVTAACEAL